MLTVVVVVIHATNLGASPPIANLILLSNIAHHGYHKLVEHDHRVGRHFTSNQLLESLPVARCKESCQEHVARFNTFSQYGWVRARIP